MKEDHVIVPLDLLADCAQACEWLQTISALLSRGEPIEPGFLELLAEQSELIQAWLKEYLLRPDQISAS